MSLHHTLANLFKTAASVMEIKGEAVFKAIAFTKVARVLEDATFDITGAVEDGSMAKVPGVGKASLKIIEEFVRTGRSTDIDELIASIPPGLIPMMRIPSLGPKTISLLWKQRGVTNVEELSAAIETGRLEGLKGIGPKKIESIKEGLTMLAAAGERRGLVEALAVAGLLVEQVRHLPGVARAEVAGSLRRWRETIGDIDIIAALADGVSPAEGKEITAGFVGLGEVSKVLGQGETKASILTTTGWQVDLRLVPKEHFGAALQYFTGSKEHNVKLRGLAQEKEMTLNEWGLYRLDQYSKADKLTARAPAIAPVAAETEEAVYAALGLDFVPPELREDRGEIELAADGRLPKLILPGDYKGDLHSHTHASDGQGSIEQMAAAARERGYIYLGITDHSKSQVVANGLSVERLLKHVKAIRAAGDKLKGIRLLAGCEVDILPDGSLDYEDAVLAELDYVVASPHISLKQDAKKATDRLLRAVDNRYVNIVGHPTGRIINRRAGLPVVFDKVFAKAAANGVAMEINAGWPRLDLNDTNARAALGAGVRLSINTDAHSVEDFDGLALGLAVARRAGAESANVINTWPLDNLLKFFAKKR